MGDIAPIPPGPPVPPQDIRSLHRLPPWIVKSSGFALFAACFGWAFDNFIQVRDVKSLYVSWVLLFIMWLSATAFVGGIVWNRTQRKLWAFGIAVLLGAAAFGADHLIPKPPTQATLTPKPQPDAMPAPGLQPKPNIKLEPLPKPVPTPEQPTPPEVVIESTSTLYSLAWIPGQNIAPILAPSDFPIIKILTLSNTPVVSSSINWSSAAVLSKNIFLSAQHFRKYAPAVSHDMYWLNVTGRGFGLQVADQENTPLPYISSDPLSVSIPDVIWNKFILALLAEAKRPPMMQGENHFIRSRLSVCTAEVKYRQGSHTFTRVFRIAAAVMLIADDTGSNGLPSLLPQFWSADNLRATLSLLVSAVDKP